MKSIFLVHSTSNPILVQNIKVIKDIKTKISFQFYKHIDTYINANSYGTNSFNVNF
jgi:hypothetical protein